MADPRKKKSQKKIRVRIRGVFRRFQKRFPGPEKFNPKSFRAREVFGSFEKRTPGVRFSKLRSFFGPKSDF